MSALGGSSTSGRFTSSFLLWTAFGGSSTNGLVSVRARRQLDERAFCLIMRELGLVVILKGENAKCDYGRNRGISSSEERGPGPALEEIKTKYRCGLEHGMTSSGERGPGPALIRTTTTNRRGCR